MLPEREKRDMEKKTKRLSPLVILCLITISCASVFGIFYFSLTKTANVNVIVNTFIIELYEDVGLTTVAATVEFPDILEGTPQATDSQVYYLHAETIEPGAPIYVMFEIVNLPPSMSVMVMVATDGPYAEWIESDPLTLDNVEPTAKLIFKINTGSTIPGAYSFDVVFDVHDSV